jgi:hypothetical protein
MIDYDVKEVLKDFLTRSRVEGIRVKFEGIDEKEIDNMQTTGH